MVFNVAVGLDNLEEKEATDKRGKTYALFLSDTVLVPEEGPPEVCARVCKCYTVCYTLYTEEGPPEVCARVCKCERACAGVRVQV